jgi:hypothetical protein
LAVICTFGQFNLIDRKIKEEVAAYIPCSQAGKLKPPRQPAVIPPP